MQRIMIGALALAMVSGPATAGMVTKKLSYTHDGKNFEGILVYDDSVQAKRPAIVMAPNWMGINQNAVTKAKLLAGQKYVFFIADMYGAGTRPKNSKQARKASGSVRKDLGVQRGRINKALDVLLAEGGKRGLIDPSRTAAVGFCFGGGNVLELARSGRNVKAVITFHGSLKTPKPGDAGNIKAKVLVLHGADDPAVPKADRDALEAEMTAGKVDYQLTVFSGTVHSFTNPQAKRPGRSMYNPVVTRRAYAMMNDLLAEVF
jgi:dienelactone hydrolase